MKSDQAFFDFGTQYYVAGRYAVFARLNPVAANLLHHAIELYLKGCLVDTLHLNDMKKGKVFGHDLLRGWQLFKSKTGDPTLDRFDGAVSDLNKYEDIRYPDDIIAKGLICSIGFGQPSVTPQRQEPQYHLDVEPIDSLARALFHHASLNPKFFVMNLAPSEREYFFKENVAFQDVSSSPMSG